MKRIFSLCSILAVMAVIIAGFQGCTSSGTSYYRDNEYGGHNGKGYNTYDYQGNRLENTDRGWHLRGSGGY